MKMFILFLIILNVIVQAQEDVEIHYEFTMELNIKGSIEKKIMIYSKTKQIYDRKDEIIKENIISKDSIIEDDFSIKVILLNEMNSKSNDTIIINNFKYMRINNIKYIFDEKFFELIYNRMPYYYGCYIDRIKDPNETAIY